MLRRSIQDDLYKSLQTYYSPEDLDSMLEALQQPPSRICFRLVGKSDEERLDTHKAVVKHFQETNPTVKVDLNLESKEKLLYPEAVQKFVLHLENALGERNKKSAQNPVHAVYVSCQTATALLRGADLFCPGVLAIRPCETSAEKTNREQRTIEADQRVEIRVAPKGIHITRGQDASLDWDEWDGISNKIGEGVLVPNSRGGIFAAQGIAVAIDTILSTKTGSSSMEIIKQKPQPSSNNVFPWKLWSQQLPSVLAALALSMQDGEVVQSEGKRVLDMCAAPGGKTMALADFLHASRQICAIDRSFTKIRKIEKACKELGRTNVSCFRMDSTKLKKAKIEEKPEEGTPDEQQSGANQDQKSEDVAENMDPDTKRAKLDSSKPAVSSHAPTAINQHYHKEVELTSELWEAFYTVILGKGAETICTKKKSEKKIFKAILGIMGRKTCNREKVDAMMRMHNSSEYKDLEMRKEAQRKVEEILAEEEDTDSTTVVASTANQTNPEDKLSPPFPAQSFDLVLCDVPCSAMGQKPLLFWNTSYDEVKKTATYQRQFMQQAYELCKTDGYFVYSTCTLPAEENELNVEWLLGKYPDNLELVDIRKEFGSNWDEERCYGFDLPDRKETEDKPSVYNRKFVVRCDPRYWDLGFFMAKFKKVA